LTTTAKILILEVYGSMKREFERIRKEKEEVSEEVKKAVDSFKTSEEVIITNK
jgi:uncharacterized protein (DUF2225 family)